MLCSAAIGHCPPRRRSIVREGPPHVIISCLWVRSIGAHPMIWPGFLLAVGAVDHCNCAVAVLLKVICIYVYGPCLMASTNEHLGARLYHCLFVFSLARPLLSPRYGDGDRRLRQRPVVPGASHSLSELSVNVVHNWISEPDIVAVASHCWASMSWSVAWRGLGLWPSAHLLMQDLQLE